MQLSQTNYLLEMIDISKEFPGVKALDNVNFRLKPGTVHALMGENGAGKSTLMKCLFGVYIEDNGEIKIEGKKVRFNNPHQALDNGVAMVHQELNQVLKRDVMDNIWLGRYPKQKIGFVNQEEMYQKTVAIFKELELDINPKIEIGKLSVSQRQMVEIAKAVSYNAKILVLDEPTSSLTEEEVKHLFKIINKLKDNGCGIIYISHKMEEILEISQEVTIMRDGKWVATHKATELTTDKIIKLMVGRELTNRFPPKTNKPSDVILEVENLTALYQPSIKNVSFTLRKGEVLGIAGLVGSRRTELVETIFGIAHHSEGTISLYGKKVENTTSRKAIDNGFALLTEERRASGIFAGLSVGFNSIIANLKDYSSLGLLKNNKMDKDTDWVVSSMNVKTPSKKTLIRSLSGGNQQKVIIGRWLLTKPEILLLDEPTRGIDVGAKYEIYQLILNLANEGKGVIMVSSEMTELLGICDRILVMSNGRVAGIQDVEQLNQEEIMRLAAKYI
ncbi:galactose/methyl galactoside ABC transporter ATP-binding protein MglA [Paludicola sp. MB14-C6]|uniref:galactose/methyl galactoside ABC transporter ATP-binding protein MglA n=1 Tax=Paludihabitans sp. MB14-C6 TaxID=3070656 RepID=UPI0027DC749B|nr:galactose/methyl galactoside ABC transporter ATP-binding protein MglA [Paludicola sp. MB14-C6]WMJ21837.1 galactose/methyl galactoside ABC transporter ATP-binding protein MglA [Paludicola sp. MB14-C6]